MVFIVFIPEADWSDAPGSDGRIREEAPEGGAQAEGQGAAGEGLRGGDGRRRESDPFVRRYGETPAPSDGVSGCGSFELFHPVTSCDVLTGFSGGLVEGDPDQDR